MANMPSAYLEAVDDVISIHVARALYFTEGTSFFEKKDMFSFRCESDCCDIPITPVNIFRDEFIYGDETTGNKTEKKRSAYFKAKKGFAAKHHEDCPYSDNPPAPKKDKDPRNSVEDPINEAIAPTEFLLTRRKRAKTRSKKLLPADEAILDSEVFDSKGRRRVSKTTSLNHIAEEWMHMETTTQRKKNPLTIADKQGNYSDCFKEVAFFKQVKSSKIILKGEVEYLRITLHFINIKFKWDYKDDKDDNIKRKICLYIPPETLKSYHKKDWFLRYIKALESSKENLIAFFIPESMTPIESAEHNSLGFRVESLDHLSILIDARK
jgi:hypothetical protein